MAEATRSQLGFNVSRMSLATDLCRAISGRDVGYPGTAVPDATRVDEGTECMERCVGGVGGEMWWRWRWIVDSESRIVVSRSRIVVSETRIVVSISRIVISESRIVVSRSRIVVSERIGLSIL